LIPRFGKLEEHWPSKIALLTCIPGTLIRMVQSTSLKPEDPQRGCPLNNLSQEMSVEIQVDELTKHRRNGTERELFAFL
jgi:hypothetical protein